MLSRNNNIAVRVKGQVQISLKSNHFLGWPWQIFYIELR